MTIQSSKKVTMLEKLTILQSALTATYKMLNESEDRLDQFEARESLMIADGDSSENKAEIRQIIVEAIEYQKQIQDRINQIHAWLKEILEGDDSNGDSK